MGGKLVLELSNTDLYTPIALFVVRPVGFHHFLHLYPYFPFHLYLIPD